ncbi:MAG: ribonuclease Z [Candidatus Thermoplasmatota archaeon]|nr:ribonuclease Z [Candidatus Thermoplasmatota archaeon]
MRSCFLGTGGSWPTRERNVLSIALTHSRNTVLLDCGEGTQRQMIGSPVSPLKIDAIVVTHLHGDHFLGIPGLVQSMSLNGRKRPLMIAGPSSIHASVESSLSSTVFRPGFEVDVREMKDGDRLVVGSLTVRCASVEHGIEALAYRVDAPPRPGFFDRAKAESMGIPQGRLWGDLQRGKTIRSNQGGVDLEVRPEQIVGPARPGLSVVYSGDTLPHGSVAALSRDADALIHEATFSDRHADLARDYLHSTAREAAEIASEAGVGSLFLVHISPRYSAPDLIDEMRKEACEVFPGAIIPSDGECFEIGRRTNKPCKPEDGGAGAVRTCR